MGLSLDDVVRSPTVTTVEAKKFIKIFEGAGANATKTEGLPHLIEKSSNNCTKFNLHFCKDGSGVEDELSFRVFSCSSPSLLRYQAPCTN